MPVKELPAFGEKRFFNRANVDKIKNLRTRNINQYQPEVMLMKLMKVHQHTNRGNLLSYFQNDFRC